jgi:hypothetical protein
VPFLHVVTDLLWYRLSVQSFYGKFGHMEVNSPVGSYGVAIRLMVLLAGATYGFLVLRWGMIAQLDRLMLLAAPACALLPVLASLYNSWSIDYQPQGRYLFAALIPLALMLGGTFTFEPRWLRGARLVIGAILYGLSLSVVWLTILGSPMLALSSIGG